MKRALLILAGFLITTGFTLYILGVDPLSIKKPIGQQADSLNDTMMVQTDPLKGERIASSGSAAPVLAGINEDVINEAQALGQTGSNNAGWKLIWADEFDKPNLDIEHWTEIDRKVSYNNELQYYLPRNSYVEDGCLYLTAKKEDWGGKAYTSAMVDSENKLVFKYGRIEARIKLPEGKGVFPAFWILTDDGGYEIDIMEMIGSEPNTIYATNHYETVRGSKRTSGYTANETPGEFHVYAVEWEKGSIRWYVDDVLYHESGRGVPSDYMYMVLNLAIGGNWPGDPESVAFPCSMVVDYVKIYTR
jgi:beta-glucanase (GH16 family)